MFLLFAVLGTLMKELFLLHVLSSMGSHALRVRGEPREAGWLGGSSILEPGLIPCTSSGLRTNSQEFADTISMAADVGQMSQCRFLLRIFLCLRLCPTDMLNTWEERF